MLFIQINIKGHFLDSTSFELKTPVSMAVPLPLRPPEIPTPPHGNPRPHHSYNHIRLIIRAGNKPVAGCQHASWGTATGPLTPFTPAHSLSHQLMMAPGCARPMSQQLPGHDGGPSCWLCSNWQHKNKCYLFSVFSSIWPLRSRACNMNELSKPSAALSHSF